MSVATSPLSQAISDDAETPPASEPSRPTDSLLRPPPPPRHQLATLDEESGFDFHDTIPAPPWLDEADADEETVFPAPAPVR